MQVCMYTNDCACSYVGALGSSGPRLTAYSCSSWLPNNGLDLPEAVRACEEHAGMIYESLVVTCISLKWDCLLLVNTKM